MKKNKKIYIPITIAILIVIAVFAKDIANLIGIDFFKSEFENKLEELNRINEKYNTTIYSLPLTIEEDKSLLEELNDLKNNIETKEPFKLLLDFRIKLAESDIFFKEGWKYGRGSTTKYGFGCRGGLPRLRNATFDRNMSSQIGYEAVALMTELIEKYPSEAKIANVTSKHALFLNASFYKEEKDASRDRKLVESACGKKEEG